MLFKRAFLFGVKSIRNAKSFATETKAPYEPPPFAPNRKGEVATRNTILFICWSVMAWVYLKPWDGESVLDSVNKETETQVQDVVVPNKNQQS